MTKKPLQQRLVWVDALRGLAIVLMVIFHFCYDLRYFGYVDWDVPNGPNWWPFRYLIVTLFVFTVGISLSLAHKQQLDLPLFLKRLVQLVAASMAITLVSILVFPDSWIYFGILHFIAAASVLGVGLVAHPKTALGLSVFFLFGFWLEVLPGSWPFEWFAFLLPDRTEDFVPLIPWLGIVFLGIGLAGILPVNRGFDLPMNPAIRPLAATGRRGLVIYLLHQPLLFAGFLLVGFAR